MSDLEFKFLDDEGDNTNWCCVKIENGNQYQQTKERILQADNLLNSIEHIIHHSKQFGGSVHPAIKSIYEKSKESTN